jgi:hypothetical protein
MIADDEVVELVLKSACQGCLLHVVDDAKGGAEDADHSGVLPLLEKPGSGWRNSRASRR